MKIVKKSCLALCAILLMLPMLILPVRAMEAFKITQYHVDLVVQEDGIITVTESMQTQFEYSRHGIFVNLPTHYEMDWNVNGNQKTEDYVFPITDVQVLSNHENEIDFQSNGVQIQIGSGDYYAEEVENYQWRYKMHTQDLRLDGMQALYTNLIAKWDTTIDNFSFSIEMPKSFDASQIEFYIGENFDNINNLTYSIEGNTITGEYHATVQPNESFTILLPLEDNYFVFPDYSYMPWLIGGGAIVLAFLVYLLFLKYGKDAPLVVSVEFEAPTGVSSAEVGYVIDGSIDTRDIVSLIMDWARKGYITIEEKEENLIFHKVKNSDSSLRDYEINMFESLFASGDDVDTKALREKFYTSINQCKTELTYYMNRKENRIFSSQSMAYRALTYVLTCIPTLLFFALPYYFERFSWAGLGFSLIGLLPLIITIVLLAMMESQRHSMTKAVKSLYYVFSLITFCTYGIVVLGYTVYMEYNLIAAALLLASTFLLCLLGQRMIKRTEHGHRLYGQVVGLRQFILVAEKDRLEAMLQDDPYLFYNILPYAYAFNLAEVWSDHFKDLIIPDVDWYMSHQSYPHSYMMGYYLTRSMMSAQSVMISTPPVEVSRGGGGIGGGGFGGGGFSGGGFGGSSGGSW